MLSLNPCKTACALLLLCLAATVSLPAQTFATLVDLNGVTAGRPFSPLVQYIDGNLYGEDGGIFKVTPAGTVTTVHNFIAGARGGLAVGTNLDLYGTSTSEGEFCFDCGSVFQITPNGTAFLVHQFAGGDDGLGPFGGVIEAADGNFYGTTIQGGGFSLGTIFKMTASGAVTTLNEFHGVSDGQTPYAGLIQATDGNFYGVAAFGGANGYGTIFKITTSGVLTVLHNFDGTDGANPQTSLVQATNGNLYGAALYGGANNVCFQGCGAIFEINPSTSAFTLLHSFDNTDGQYPTGLIQATDGNLYGATVGCVPGNNCVPVNQGTVFQITPTGTLTTLHSFTGPDGESPAAAPVQATNGMIYGTTLAGGPGYAGFTPSGSGTIYTISLGAAPFVTAVPPARHVGQKILILGTGLTGATSVTFNGVSATFTVSSDTRINATVPAGATSGSIQVVTPSGTLSSNIAFVVP